MEMVFSFQFSVREEEFFKICRHAHAFGKEGFGLG
jgi:hypothetical protein